MMAQANRAASLIPLQEALVTALEQVEDQMFVANSESWAAATVHCSMLKRLAKTNGDLQKAIVSVEQFFAFRASEAIAKRAAKRAAKKAIGAQHAPEAPTPPVETQPAPAASGGHA